MKRIAMLCLFTVISTAATAGFDEGLTAYNNKEYAAAIKEWQPLAEQGNASAQFNLGLMYHEGRGIEKDGKQAAYWYGKAAEAGVLDAQFNLALLYEAGGGVPQDYYEAVKLYYSLKETLDSRLRLRMLIPLDLQAKVNAMLLRGSPEKFVDAMKKLDQEKALAEAVKMKEEEEIKRRTAEIREIEEKKKAATMAVTEAAEIRVANDIRVKLRAKDFRQSFKTSSVCRDFERQSNAMMTRWEIGMSHPDEGRKFLSDVAVSFDECSRSAGFGKSKLRDAYISNFNGIKLMQSVWERGISACMDGDRLLRSAGGGSFNNCKWMEMPIQDYEGRSIVSELKSSVVGYGDLIEREAERRKYRNYFGPVLKAVGDRLIKF